MAIICCQKHSESLTRSWTPPCFLQRNIAFPQASFIQCPLPRWCDAHVHDHLCADGIRSYLSVKSTARLNCR